MTNKEHLQVARTLAKLLDAQFSLLGFSFGIDPVFDIIPGIGTVVPSLLSLYIVWIGYQVRVPRIVFIRILFNFFVDSLLGSIPVLGVFVDAAFKANLANLQMIEQHFNNSQN